MRDLQHFPLVREPLSQPDQRDQVSSQDDPKQGYVNGIFVHKSLLQAEPHLNSFHYVLHTQSSCEENREPPEANSGQTSGFSEHWDQEAREGRSEEARREDRCHKNLPVTPARMQTSSAHIDVSDCVSAHLTAPSVC